MAENSKIEWTDATFNPVWGCTRVSPGCDHCYAETLAKRYGFGVWGVGKARREFGDKHWAEPQKWNRAAEKAGKRLKVFCASMADWLDNKWPPGVRERLCETIDQTPHLDWQLLSKRIGNAAKLVPKHWREKWPDNAWAGISVVNQEEADRDIPKLLAVPARVRFLSCEPLLGPIYLGRAGAVELYRPGYDTNQPVDLRKDFPQLEAHGLVDWVIVAGESGPGARPMQTSWALSLRDQCSAAGVPFFFKQWGEWRTDSDGLHRLGKKRAGRLLDGREWSEFPTRESRDAR